MCLDLVLLWLVSSSFFLLHPGSCYCTGFVCCCLVLLIFALSFSLPHSHSLIQWLSKGSIRTLTNSANCCGTFVISRKNENNTHHTHTFTFIHTWATYKFDKCLKSVRLAAIKSCMHIMSEIKLCAPFIVLFDVSYTTPYLPLSVSFSVYMLHSHVLSLKFASPCTYRILSFGNENK